MVATMVNMTRTCYSALEQLREHQEEEGQKMSLAILAGGLISEALAARGYLKRAQYAVKDGGETEIPLRAILRASERL